MAEAALENGEFLALAVDASKPVDQRSLPVDAAGGVLTGRVSAVLGADRAHKLVVPTKTSSGPALFLVDVGAAGVSVEPRSLVDKSRGVAEVALAGVSGVRLEVNATAVLSEAALRAAVLMAADSLGAMERMLELAVEYSKQRQQFGVPIGSFQAVKHAAASLLVEVEAAKSMVYFAAASLDQEHPDRVLHAAAAKAQVTSAGQRCADTALTMHGAIGYTWEHDLHLFYKRAKLNERLFGAPSVWNERIASALPLVAAG
ncbi:MAG: acyl-CoA dehydrogenase family protein [Thermocrispum sp.]